ncbi:MAG: two pore domain potassium channel family protein [Actinobacteria bacterium]|nr:two pore domain potassium channel family protein [Actinomycetota bacterium]MBU2110278.1 two pore domain potassium channel family protein [Actinomycetota bacterium]
MSRRSHSHDPRPGGVLGPRPSAVLLGAQLLVVLAFPFLEGSPGGRAVLGVGQMLAVGAAVAAVRRTPALTWVALTLGVPAGVFTVLEAVAAGDGGAEWIVLTSALLHAPFYFYVSYSMIRYVFHDDRVTRDELYATGAAFTVVAWGFAYVYAAVQVVWPDSFAGTGSEGVRSWFELLYLSFSVLTSVGLSDVVPVGAHARSLVAVEMIAGVLYVALVVSRLVGLVVSRQAMRAVENPSDEN